MRCDSLAWFRGRTVLKFLVIDITTTLSQTVDTCDEAARIAQVILEDVELELDTLGVYESDQYTIVEILV